MTNELIKKEINTDLGVATLIIYETAQLAIEKGWESLYFADNNDTFASVEIADQIAVLETHGEIRISAVDRNEVLYRNDNVEEIRQLLDEDKLDEFEVGNNNWFAVVAGNIVGREEDVTKIEMVDDSVFEATPESIEELEATLIDYAVDLISRIKE